MKKTKSNLQLCADEAKKLGLKAEYVQSTPKKKSLLVSNSKRFFLLSTGSPGFYPEVKRWNAHLTGSKLLTQKVLKQYGYKTIASKEIRVADFSSARTLGAEIEKKRYKFPLLLKPDRGKDGLDINIVSTVSELTKAARGYYARKHDFIIQPILDQDEYRILVVNNEVVLMHSKHNPYIIGDGISTIGQILKKVPDKRKDPTFIAWQHKKLKTKASTVLEAGAHFEYHLTKVATPHYCKTKNFSTAAKKWALKLADTLSAPVVAIDLFIPGTMSDTDHYTIIELNSNPALYHLPHRLGDHEIAPKIINKILRNFFKLT